MAKRNKQLHKVFGASEVGIPDLPHKCGSVRVARITHLRDRGGCSFCFPHGLETDNSTRKKNRRSWKLHRQKQYRSVTIDLSFTQQKDQGNG